MSSQNPDHAIPLNLAPNGHTYRLLELPPDLAAALDGPDAPTMTLAADPAATAAILSAADRQYALRQLNTSNALMLLAPAGGAQPGLDIVATLHETVELMPHAAAEAEGAAKPAPSAKGKWHEKFGRSR